MIALTPPVEQVIEKYRKLIFWQFHRAGIPDEESEDVLAEVNLYMVEQWHRYDPRKSAPQTFLYWQVRGAIRRWQRRENRYRKYTSAIISMDMEETVEVIDNLSDWEQTYRCGLEDQIIMKESLADVLRLSFEFGINVFDTDHTSVEKEALLAIWDKISA